MPEVLDYPNGRTPTVRPPGTGCLLTGCASLSAVLLVLTLAMWSRSHTVSAPAVGPRGEAAAPPPEPHLILPMPSDAAQYWVPLNGRLERWEYSGWDNKWYRWSTGMILPLWLPALCFAILPLVWAKRRWLRRRFVCFAFLL